MIVHSIDVSSVSKFRSLSYLFEINKFSVRLVGGCVRDILRGDSPSDYDICTNATPDQMMEIFENSSWTVIPTGISHGTLTIVSGDAKFEITTLRKDLQCDGRHSTVEFTDDWKQDALRRDFTINSMSVDIYGNVYDYCGGFTDLRDNVVRFIGKCRDRIAEDHLRILRYFRFISRYNSLALTEEKLYCYENIRLLSNISPERVWEEFKKGFNQVFHMHLIQSGFYKQIFKINHDIDIDCHDDPILTAGEIVSNVDNFCELMRCSNQEKDTMKLVKHLKSIPVKSSNDVKLLLRQGYDKDTVLKYYFRRTDIEDFLDLLNFVPEKFPVSGQDLLNIGFVQGRQLGKTLSVLRDIWLINNCSISKDQLINKIHVDV